MKRFGWGVVKVALLVVVPLRVLIACDTPPPNPLATSGAGGAPPVMSGTGGSAGSGGSQFIGAGGAGGRPAPAPVVSAASALTVEASAADRVWPTTSCPGGPCAAPRVCVNLDSLFVACVACGGNDQICCPAGDACDAGLVCGPNPNYQQSPPRDLVKDVCQPPGAPPAADYGLNHQRKALE